MKTVPLVLIAVGFAAAAAACSSSPPPTAQFASSQATLRSAREIGAENDPQAALHLKLADEELDTARRLIRDNENKQAATMVRRANSDAELALQIARARNARVELDKSRQLLNQQPQPTPATNVKP